MKQEILKETVSKYNEKALYKSMYEQPQLNEMQKKNILLKLKLPPLSMQITGNSDQLLKLNDTIQFQIEHKDSTTVKEAPTGSSKSYGKGNGRYSFRYNQLFESPVIVDDLKGIRLLLKSGEECWIPIQV